MTVPRVIAGLNLCLMAELRRALRFIVDESQDGVVGLVCCAMAGCVSGVGALVQG